MNHIILNSAHESGPTLNCHYSQIEDLYAQDNTHHTWLKSLSPQIQWACPLQTHSKTIYDLDLGFQSQPEADALITSSPNLGIAIWGSDCPGLIINCGDGHFGAAHCGWRGIAANLPTLLCGALREKSSFPTSQWSAYIGPGICQDCYEVDQPVLASFSWPKASLKKVNSTKALLDLRMAISCQCQLLGIEKITISPICTAENSNHHSYRQSGAGRNNLMAVYC
ncbi:MAG: polyphenol oxidase family protein [Planctomycetes bacterium]|nr:polyphenol oxidase family protein [Planctomycetota bacterium]